MLASKRCKGSPDSGVIVSGELSWCRREPGQVCATASAADRTRLLTRAPRNKRIENGVSRRESFTTYRCPRQRLNAGKGFAPQSSKVCRQAAEKGFVPTNRLLACRCGPLSWGMCCPGGESRGAFGLTGQRIGRSRRVGPGRLLRLPAGRIREIRGR